MSDETAHVSFLPCHDGDGYSFGGGVILTIGDRSLYIGSGRTKDDENLAKEIARRWNAGAATLASIPEPQK